MKTLENKIDKIDNEITELRIVAVRQEENARRSNEILAELKDSVVHHIARTDALEELVNTNKVALDRKISFMHGILWATGAATGLFCGLMGTLYQTGTLQKIIHLLLQNP